MKRSIPIILCLFWATGAYGETVTIHPTIPGTGIRDYGKPSVVIEDGKIYETIVGTGIRDYSKPMGVIKDGEIYRTIPGTTIRDYSQPAYKFAE